MQTQDMHAIICIQYCVATPTSIQRYAIHHVYMVLFNNFKHQYQYINAYKINTYISYYVSGNVPQIQHQYKYVNKFKINTCTSYDVSGTVIQR